MHVSVVSRRTGKKKPGYKLLDLNPLDEPSKTPGFHRRVHYQMQIQIQLLPEMIRFEDIEPGLPATA